jgi:hypothetical protein
MKLTLAASCIAVLLAAGTVAAQTTAPAGQQPGTVVRPPAPAPIEDPQKPGSPGTQSGAAPSEQNAPASGATQDRPSSSPGGAPSSSMEGMTPGTQGSADDRMKSESDRIRRN